jgi:SAM-dependent methyltransferase
VESLKVINDSKKYNWNYKKTAFELFKIMNPEANEVSLLVAFNKYINFLKKNLKFKKNVSILDYGSGNGFTIYYFNKQKLFKTFYSKDVNIHFINIQKKIIKFCDFELLNPEKNYINEKSKSIDWVISNAVLHCLPNKIYAKKLILEMVRIARKGVFISDIFNTKYKKKFIAKQMKRQGLSKKEYIKKYKATPHLYFSKTYFNFLKNKKLKYKIVRMPESFYDSQFGRFAVRITF